MQEDSWTTLYGLHTFLICWRGQSVEISSMELQVAAIMDMKPPQSLFWVILYVEITFVLLIPVANWMTAELRIE